MNKPTTDPAELVRTRSTTHGNFIEQAIFYEDIMDVWQSSPNWNLMPPYMRYNIEYQTKKLARIACGDFEFIDHWADLGGYVKLVVDILLKKIEQQGPGTPEDGGHHSKMD